MILNNYRTIKGLIIIVLILWIAKGKCLNSSEFKYDLKEPAELINYYSLCSEFARRTCCSQNNFQLVTKKIVKVMGGNVSLSNPCRFMLTNGLCSVCDGDIGEQLKEGVCSNYCLQFYDNCKDDYFSFDNNNQLRVCKEEDIICSKLKDIVGSSKKESVCQLMEWKIGQHNCWNGEVSSHRKGPAKKKIRSFSNNRTKKGHSSPGIQQFFVNYKHIVIPSALLLMILAFFGIKKAQSRYAMWKRQIRNL